MPWNPALNQLRDVLADLYPDVADARRVAASASLPLERVTLQGKPINDWQSILEEAEKQGRVEALIAVGVAEYGGNRAFVAAVEAYRCSGAGALSSTRAARATVADPLVLSLGGGVALQLVRVPAGAFLMGSSDSDPLANDNEKPQHKLWLPEYLIAKYEVTVAQYRTFVQACHYEVYDPDSLNDPDDHPMVYVNWPESLVFCEWASRMSGYVVSLPTEAEWEKAARWHEPTEHARIYPWGDRWDSRRCNSEERGPGSRTPVGHYGPIADSPYGCADMAGNVWEWTRSLWGQGAAGSRFQYPYDPGDGRENIYAEEGMLRVVRGGAFHSSGSYSRCACRGWSNPRNHFPGLGFRVVVLPISP